MKPIKGLDAIRRRHAEIESIPMFDVQPTSREPTPRVRAPRIVDTTQCKVCGKKDIGVIAIYDPEAKRRAFVIKDHLRVTYGGHAFTCAGSGVEP